MEGVSLAYQTWGEGRDILVATPPLALNIELMWERPEYARMLGRVGTFARGLHYDKRGTGMSDRTVRVPTVDEHVEDLRAVMDEAGIERATLAGVSEGGPIAIAFAATYPERVDRLILMSSGARLVGAESLEERANRQALFELFADRWGTDESMTLDVFAPSVASDPDYRAWQPRFERLSATPAALRELLAMIGGLDVRPLLGSVEAPSLVLHRRDDPVWPIAFAREAAAGLRDAKFVELDGGDHFPHVGDADAWIDYVEDFMTGAVHRPAPTASRGRSEVKLQIMGGFAVSVDGEDVSSSDWGSRRARQLCKRLALAIGEPVPRDVLIEMLWPDESDPIQLGARLSVLLSNIRRVLKGGLAADRAAVRLDLDTLRLDVHSVYDALARGDDKGAVDAYRGPVLPEDAYDDWAIAGRERLSFAIMGRDNGLQWRRPGRRSTTRPRPTPPRFSTWTPTTNAPTSFWCGRWTQPAAEATPPAPRTASGSA